MTLIIAEAGVNHNGCEKLAFKLVDAAFSAGVDIVKFQTFKTKKMVTSSAKQCEYQIKNTGKTESQFDMLTRLELSYEFHHDLLQYCNELGIEFLSSAFDEESLAFLVDDLGLKKLKIASGELTNAPLLLLHAQTNVDLIVSTGMATLDEVELALGVIAFGYQALPDTAPSMEAFHAAFLSIEGQQLLKEKVTILHCSTEYPAPMVDINLKAMDTLRTEFKLATGYSDHSSGIEISIAAVARGAVLIEKHFTLDKNMKGPDHKASLDPVELKAMTFAIRNVELAIGDGIKAPRPSEIKNKVIARKSLVAAKSIVKGEIFNHENLHAKRPGNGLSPYCYWELLNSTATISYQEGDIIDE